MALFFIPVANVVMGAVPGADEGVASGANNAIRELGGVLGIAVLATVFSGHGGYASAVSFASGVRAATWVGAAVVGAGALAALAIPSVRAHLGRSRDEEAATVVAAPAVAAAP